MVSQVTLLCAIFLSWLAASLAAENVTISIATVTSIAETDDHFICATMDWWPPTKCDYNVCAWQNAGLFDLDLDNRMLMNAIKAFEPLRIRVGGSLEDQLLYKVGNAVKDCPTLRKGDHLFGYTMGCLDMNKWDQINNLFNKTGARLTFGLNALFGKKPAGTSNDLLLWTGHWNSQNARDLMEYTIAKGWKIDSYELGNELCGSGVSVRIEANQYAADSIVLRNLVNELYPDPKTRPKVLGPGGFYDKAWFNTYLQLSGPNVLDGVTHHIYNLGSGRDPELINRIQDPYYLDRVAETFKDVMTAVKTFTPWAGPWVGESGGAYNSGGIGVSNTFADGFWYLDQLGMTSTFNHKAYCRQALIGGNYGLIDSTSFVPNPDYYGALLWNRLMGKTVLATSHSGSPYLRAYSHCSKKKPGIAMLLINLSNSTAFEVLLAEDLNLYATGDIYCTGTPGTRQEYHLTPKDGDIHSTVVLLNGTPLELTDSLDIPTLEPKNVSSTAPLTVAPSSFVFVTLPNFIAPACA